MRSVFASFFGRVLPLGLLAVVAACTDQTPLIAPPASESRAEIAVQALTCTVDVPARTVTCVDRAGQVADSTSWVRLASRDVGYASDVVTFDVTAQNLVPQTLGVSASGEYDGAGVRIFFTDPPVVTSGTGTVTVNGAETGRLTRAGQPFYRYPQALRPNETSAPRQWSFAVPATVNSFRYTLRVAASVQHPRGWVEIRRDPSCGWTAAARGRSRRWCATRWAGTSRHPHPPSPGASRTRPWRRSWGRR